MAAPDQELEYFAPWAVTSENSLEALGQVVASIDEWRKLTEADGHWAENTDEVMDNARDLVDAVIDALRANGYSPSLAAERNVGTDSE